MLSSGPNAMIKMLLQEMLPMKIDTNIKLVAGDGQIIDFALKGDIFISNLKGEKEKRVFFALKLHDDEEKEETPP